MICSSEVRRLCFYGWTCCRLNAGGSTCKFGLVVEGHVAELLLDNSLDISDVIGFGRGAEVEADFFDQLSYVFNEIAASQVLLSMA